MSYSGEGMKGDGGEFKRSRGMLASLAFLFGEPVILKRPRKKYIYKNLLSVIKRSLYLYIIFFRFRYSLSLSANTE
jgi:hypothetical protein